MSDTKLKPCPFCGEQGALIDSREFDGNVNVGCGCKVEPSTESDGTVETAVKQWNTRPVEAELAAIALALLHVPSFGHISWDCAVDDDEISSNCPYVLRGDYRARLRELGYGDDSE